MSIYIVKSSFFKERIQMTENLLKDNIRNLIFDEEQEERHRLNEKFSSYYLGDHAILHDPRRRRRYRIVANFCKRIIDEATSILISKPFSPELGNHLTNMDIVHLALLHGNSWALCYRKDGEFSYKAILDSEIFASWDEKTDSLKEVLRVYTPLNVKHEKLILDLYQDKMLHRFSTDNSLSENSDFKYEGSYLHGFNRLPFFHFAVGFNASQSRYGISDLTGLLALQDAFNAHESDWSDILDYHGFPQLVLKNIENLGSGTTSAEKEMDDGVYFTRTIFKRGVDEILLVSGSEADVKYVPRELATESFREKRDELKTTIFNLSCTPLVDKNSLAGNVAGVTIKLLYKDAETKARLHSSRLSFKFREMFNFLNEAAKSNERIDEIIFNLSFPTNETEIIANLTSSIQGGLLSRESALEIHPFINNPEKERARLDNENKGKEKI
ncbi:MAG: phage portal protein [Candidatus Coatesbacteria bacterium]|nr:phage portal protein [Candidatus Coatesbacteria bacterium]